MSEIKVNKISPRAACGTTTLGDSGDTFTIPSGVTISNSGTASGFGSTGEVSWNTTVQTASSVSGVAGVGYFMNTTGNTITLNLPAGTAGSSIAVADYAAQFQNNNLTISPNGSQKIGGVNASVTLSTEGQSAYFVYIDDTQGWINVIDSTSNIRGNAFLEATGGTVTTSGNDKIHTFTGPGTFAVTNTAVCATNNIVSYLVVAGGGAGGAGNAGGGGAGGYREVKSPVTPYTASPLDGYPSAPNRVTVTATSFPITVGGGGTAGPVSATAAGAGNPSVFSTITSTGGGGGASGRWTPSVPYPSAATAAQPGGSGGGGVVNNTTQQPGGTGNTPPVSPSQGNSGGISGSPPNFSSGGGGGAGAAGTGGTGPTAGGNGGNGVATEITGSSVTRAGGGAGNGYAGCFAGTGGTGGGGSSPGVAGTVGQNGTANTGGGASGGAGACGGSAGGVGGSGVVIIRYKFQ